MGAGTGVFTNPGQSATSASNPYANTTSPYIQAAQQTALGNLAGAQAATAANRVNQSTPYANLNYVQTGTDANGNPIYSANQTFNPTLQSALGNISGNVQNTSAAAFNPTNLPSTGINPGQSYQQAEMQILQPQLQHQQQMVNDQLANQGIQPGSEAWTNAQNQLANNQNNLLAQATTQGLNAGLTANQQAYNQQLQTYNNPLQQLAAFNTATNPGYVTPYNQAATTGADYNSAVQAAQNAQIAANNAQLGQSTNLTSGLFGLGSSLASAATPSILSALGL
jgi:hypothetical protein